MATAHLMDNSCNLLARGIQCSDCRLVDSGTHSIPGRYGHVGRAPSLWVKDAVCGQAFLASALPVYAAIRQWKAVAVLVIGSFSNVTSWFR